MKMKPSPCPRCHGSKRRTQYLCSACWFALSPAAQRALNRRDKFAVKRLGELYDQVHAGVAAHEIRITP